LRVQKGQNVQNRSEPSDLKRRKILKKAYKAPVLIALGELLRPQSSMAGDGIISQPPPPPTNSAQSAWQGE